MGNCASTKPLVDPIKKTSVFYDIKTNKSVFINASVLQKEEIDKKMKQQKNQEDSEYMRNMEAKKRKKQQQQKYLQKEENQVQKSRKESQQEENLKEEENSEFIGDKGIPSVRIQDLSEHNARSNNESFCSLKNQLVDFEKKMEKIQIQKQNQSASTQNDIENSGRSNKSSCNNNSRVLSSFRSTKCVKIVGQNQNSQTNNNKSSESMKMSDIFGFDGFAKYIDADNLQNELEKINQVQNPSIERFAQQNQQQQIMQN
ncbi:hypothetical protein PPERSA_07238 [Pseudocohnilembus persalinus]|uniref:Uncharacterized protein n=1 Tax=Pseudocohnilembus persalinus TaxID=266149 RepID=A0A0V0QCV7_PSEPJ|nr:hypothetical protein PPERSA_07238 [Pseudocohnilembus persalinus]|eukprot:KRX00041.1 hypothetical protein PPERSA_07238 [Pseudocohnilembus persalinus]